MTTGIMAKIVQPWPDKICSSDVALQRFENSLKTEGAVSRRFMLLERSRAFNSSRETERERESFQSWPTIMSATMGFSFANDKHE